MPLVETEDDSATTIRSDGNSARRKHHRLWTISEVRKLVDGVSQCGVGKWSQIKRLFFSSSDYRTPVDLKVLQPKKLFFFILFFYLVKKNFLVNDYEMFCSQTK